ncbi:hypothetical protein [Caenimonas koreensis]|uniref:hypothetical protein n=1 Tax=Caenimonas koreensis TaxID=367474 RepID=UPI003784A04E
MRLIDMLGGSSVRKCLVIALSGLLAFGAVAAEDSSAQRPVRAVFTGGEAPSLDVQDVADRIVQSADNKQLPFIVIDKAQARVFVFYPDGRLRGATPALLGLAIGDHTVPGIGQRKLSSIRPDERTTPAGRFKASLDKDIHGIEVLWVDYDSALSLHRVVQGTPKERRAQRLASPDPAQRRISFGCINVPVRFYDEVVSPAFKGTYGIVYILPETKPAREVFTFLSAQ